MNTGLKILSCGAGMQSTALALMSCENKICCYEKNTGVPVYDLIVFCDLGEEPPWVYDQVEFIANACDKAAIEFVVIKTNLYSDYMASFGNSRVVSIPWWSINEDGTKSKIAFRTCTIDYKITAIQKYVRYELLGYKPRQRTKEHDKNAHEMHLGFSFEEKQRCKENPHPMFVNNFPLVELGLVRADNYAYILERWGLETKASACSICPFHQNYYFKYMKDNHPGEYQKIVAFDEMLEIQQPKSKLKAKVFISRTRKRIKDLDESECGDAQTFKYNGVEVWNGF